MDHIQKIIRGCVSLVKDGVAPDRARLTQALGLDPHVGEFANLLAQTVSLLTDGRCVENGLRVSVSISSRERCQVAFIFDEPAATLDEPSILAMAASVSVTPSRTGLGRAYVFEQDGVRCAVTVSNATNAVDGVLCEAL